MAEFAKQLQLRRGTLAEHSTFAGAEGEITYITDTKHVTVHDGERLGGYTLLTKDDLSNYVTSDLLDAYRPKEIKIGRSDLDEEITSLLGISYDDTELRTLIANLQSNKLGVSEASTLYRSKDDTIVMSDLDNSIQTAITDATSIRTTLEEKADKTALNNYRLNSVTITFNDLNSSLQEKINLTDNISINASNIASLSSRIEDLEKNGTGGGTTGGGDSVWTLEEKTSALADITNLKNESANHASSSDLTELTNRVITVENTSASHATNTQLSAVEKKADDNTDSIAGLTSRVSTLEVKVEGLSPSDGTSGGSTITDSQFNALTEKVTTNEGNIATLSTSYGSLSKQVSALDTKVGTLETDLASATTAAASAKTASDENTRSINEINTKIGAYDSGDHDKILSNETEIGRIKTSLNEVTTDVSDIESKLGSSGSSDVTTAFGKINDLASKISTLNASSSDTGSIAYKLENIDHSSLKNINGNDSARHITTAEYDELMGMTAINATVAQLVLDVKALKEGSSGTTTETYTDCTGKTRTLSNKIVFTGSTNVYHQNVFKDKGISNFTYQQVYGVNFDENGDDDPTFEDNKIEIWSYGIAGNPVTVPKYVPYKGQTNHTVETSTYVTDCDLDPESGELSVDLVSSQYTILLELRIYE